eukprot:TRINITY_DN14263_c0_g1_i1.p1 TRINITY_DN14263_c0_g1~~TRINITY_DN14263_c0_g1_i1.p1  ORF type:complete len:195 (+),score=28.69 TRINITY_DN14263_c0_g1_i1:77-661(+)
MKRVSVAAEPSQGPSTAAFWPSAAAVLSFAEKEEPSPIKSSVALDLRGDGTEVWNANLTPRGRTFPHLRRVQRDAPRNAQHILSRVGNLQPPPLPSPRASQQKAAEIDAVGDIYVQRMPAKTVAILKSVCINRISGWEIKQMIKASTGIPMGGLNLMFGGTLLKDEEALGHLCCGYAAASTPESRLKITLWAVS